MVRHRWIKNNYKVIKLLTKNGFISPSVLSNYEVYCTFEKMRIPSTMQRYHNAGKEHNLSSESVRKIVKYMQKEMR